MIVLVAILACGGGQPVGEIASQYPSTPIENISASPLKEAPDFEFTLYQGNEELGGRKLKFSDLYGNKPIVLNFWAGLCPPCRAEMPELQAFYDEFGDRVILLGLDIGLFTLLGSKEDAQMLLRQLNITYPTGYPPGGQFLKGYKVLLMPTTVFITADGKIFEKWDGPLSKETLGRISNEILRAQGTP